MMKFGVLCALALAALFLACAEPAPAPVSQTPSPVSAVNATPAPVVAQVPERPSAPSPPASPAAAAASMPGATLTPPPSPTPSPSPTVEIASIAGLTPTLSPSPVPTPPATPTQGVLASIRPEPPDRDLFELAQRLRPTRGGSISRTVNPRPVSYQEGHQETFWVSDLVDAGAYTIQATLKLVSKHAYWYVDDLLEIAVDDLKEAARVYESRILPIMTGSFGDIWDPGVDNDPRLTILHTPLRAADGYYGSRDEYPRQTHPRSNEREMIYVDGTRLTPGSPAYLGVLTHELQHAVHWNLDSGEDAWVNEGMAELAKEMAGYGATFVDIFLARSDSQLNYWPDESSTSPPHYGAATLFLGYLTQHYGGGQGLKELARESADGINGVEAYLSQFGRTFLDVFKDWVVANYVDAQEGPFGYPNRSVRVRDVDFMISYGERKDVLPQFSARYIDVRLKEGDALVSFQGESEVSQVGSRCYSGRLCWWGNRGDSIDSTMTREFDLSGLDRATLEFWTWFSLEKDWDYAYVEVSSDGGETWTLLEGQHTTSENPVGNSYGHGFTGDTNGWVEEKIDLSLYAGGNVMLRFEYITDDAVYLDGFLIDDIAIPETGFLDDAERSLGWQADGFLRTDNRLAQDYVVQVIVERSDGRISVRDMDLDAGRNGQLLIEGFGSVVEHAVVVVSPVTRGTHQPAPYSLRVARP